MEDKSFDNVPQMPAKLQLVAVLIKDGMSFIWNHGHDKLQLSEFSRKWVKFKVHHIVRVKDGCDRNILPTEVFKSPVCYHSRFSWSNVD